uniref:C-type lectin domain-containing protein n=1 Tax=Strongyloides stercoralis TaxID=6248 RepID=A0A0K0EHA2_STRER
MKKILYYLFYLIFLLEKYSLANVWNNNDYQKCSSDTSGLYLDIIFIIDISENAAKYDIQRQTGILLQFILTSSLTMDDKKMQSSRVAIITADEEATVIGDLNTFKTNNDIINALQNINFNAINGKKLDIIKALNTADNVIKVTGRKNNYKKLVILFSSHDDICCDDTSSFGCNYIYGDICRRAADFKNNGNILMTIRVDYEGQNSLYNNSIASPCYSLNFDNQITQNMLNLALQANCFCDKLFHQFEDTNNCIKTSECLYLEDTPSSYTVAEEMAKSVNGSLVDIRSELKQEFLLSLANQSLPIFIGLNQLSNYGTWKWDTGLSFNQFNDYNQFAPGEIKKNGMCGSLKDDFKWYATDCNALTNNEAYVFQKKACDTNNFCN